MRSRGPERDWEWQREEDPEDHTTLCGLAIGSAEVKVSTATVFVTPLHLRL